MTRTFNPPPNWPQPPVGWSPPPNWQPDPAWGPAPNGWRLWVDSSDTAALERREQEARTQRVFISYRRSDCQPQANGLHDGLRHRLKTAHIFMDIDSIPPGADFEQHIRHEMEVCDVVLVLIGDNWLDPRPGSDIRRIDETDDFVRLEVESALASPRVRILPVLVEGAQMPRAADLPESIRRLARINAIELSDHRWTSDLERLTDLVERIGEEQQLRAKRSVRVARERSEISSTEVSTPPEQEHDSARESDLCKGHVLAEPEPEPVTSEPTRPALSSAASRPAAAGDRRSEVIGWVMVAVPLLSCGLAAFVPALWAVTQARGDRRFQMRMGGFSALVGIAMFVGFVLVGTSPTDADGSVTGVKSDIGAGMILGTMLIASVVAFLYRKPRKPLPGTAWELAKRQRREEYRRLAANDANLARSIGVGRPDLPRDYSDGGLLDLNALSAADLSRFTPMPLGEAERVVETRQRLGSLSSIDEVIAYANLSEVSASRLKESGIFL